jgi:alpha,alpha-trehalase
MDEIETYGFIPNGGRKVRFPSLRANLVFSLSRGFLVRQYYLNRSQPPVFTQMLAKYVEFTGNTTILERALPLADKEFEWWSTNRTTTVVSPYTNTTHAVSRYNVFVNTAPRPEGYVEDYETVNLSVPALNETEAEALYVELASGAESGWDYTARWMKEPLKNVSDPYAGLRSLKYVFHLSR